MNIAIIPSSPIFYANKFFDVESSRDQVLEPFYSLKIGLEKSGYRVNTFDVYKNPSDIDLIIVHRIDLNFKKMLKIIKANPFVKIVYLVTEPENICPLHVETILRNKTFDVVLTWDDSIIDNIYFIKCWYPNPLRKMETPLKFHIKKHLLMINSYKIRSYNKKGSLYQEKLNIIRYFAKNRAIDLYGERWENCPDPLIKKVYQGPVESKIKTIKKYRFAIAFENSNNSIGGITEKIFDVMAAACVPIYWGAPNILDHIPEGTFIDYRNFIDYEQLDKYLMNMSEERYTKYLEEIEIFLKSDDYIQFTSEGFVKSIHKAISKINYQDRCKISVLQIKYDMMQKVLFNMRRFYRERRFILDLITA